MRRQALTRSVALKGHAGPTASFRMSSTTEVFRYPFLWKRAQLAGEIEGRTPIGTFCSVFTSKVLSSLIALARLGWHPLSIG